MLRKTFNSIYEALQSIKANFFHTFLSVLGIVIGVGALVTILSLIDGMEKYAHEQISKTTSIEAVILQSDAYIMVDGVRVKKDSLEVVDYTAFKSLAKHITLKGAKTFIQASKSGRFYLNGSADKKVGILRYVNNELRPDTQIISGTWLTASDLENKRQNIVVNSMLSEALKKENDDLINKNIIFERDTFKIVGVIEEEATSAKAYIPFTLLNKAELLDNMPATVALAESVESVPELKKQVNQWVEEYYGERKSNFRISTNDSRVEQANQGFLLFRIIMGLIVGISVVVGGIGVMNVLIISVTERTKEIGIRKAIGAKKFDIVLQFLAESVTISAFGSLLGIILGVLFTLAAIPIIKALIKAPFQAAFTLNTLLIIAITSVVIGVVFGTYPAIKASKLDPVDAIRHE